MFYLDIFSCSSYKLPLSIHSSGLLFSPLSQIYCATPNSSLDTVLQIVSSAFRQLKFILQLHSECHLALQGYYKSSLREKKSILPMARLTHLLAANDLYKVSCSWGFKSLSYVNAGIDVLSWFLHSQSSLITKLLPKCLLKINRRIYHLDIRTHR